MAERVHYIEDRADRRVLCRKCGWVSGVSTGTGRPLGCGVAKAERKRKGNGAFRRRNLGDHCELCGATNDLHIDHKHGICSSSAKSTKTHRCDNCFRGTLCRRCNHAIGHIERLVELGLLDKAMAWTEKI